MMRPASRVRRNREGVGISADTAGTSARATIESLKLAMQRRKVLLGLAAAAGVQAAPSPRDRFFGVWKLISYESKSANGDVRQVYGPNPVGRITYDKAGRMSAALMRPGRKSPANARNATVEELREVQSGFVAYFGKFDVDEATHTVFHHVEAALNPAWPGTDLKRTYDFTGDKLILTAASANGSSLVLTWQKEPD